MKLLSYGLEYRMEPRLAFSLGDYVIDVMRASLWMKEDRKAQQYLNLPSSMRLALQDWSQTFALLKQLEEAFESIEVQGLSIFNRSVAHLISDIAIFVPIPDPPSLRYFKTVGKDQMSGFNFGNTQTLFGHGQAQPYSGLTPQGELAAVLAGSKAGSELKIAGYCIANNWVDIQLSDSEVPGQGGLSRGIATSLGPFLITADELDAHKLGNGFNLDMQVRVNGAAVGEGRLKDMSIAFPDMIRQAAKTNVQAGDLFCSGSPISLADSPCPEMGDLVEVEIQALGCLANRVQPTFP